jgi:hypothetical protein
MGLVAHLVGLPPPRSSQQRRAPAKGSAAWVVWVVAGVLSAVPRADGAPAPTCNPVRVQVSRGRGPRLPLLPAFPSGGHCTLAQQLARARRAGVMKPLADSLSSILTPPLPSPTLSTDACMQEPYP